MKWMRHVSVIIMWAALGGCGSLQPVKSESPSTYALDARFDASATQSPAALTVVVAKPREGAGFDSARMAYVKKPHELEYFSRNQWVDSPGKMLAPLLVRALDTGGAFRAVIQAPAPVSGDLRLESDIVRLQQEFLTTPSRVRFTLRVQLIDVPGKRVIATREFDVLENAPSDDPYGGVVAANRAVRHALAEVAAFCAAQGQMPKP